MEENLSGDDEKSKKVSPKVARPKLPKFGSHTLGHHYRHKTDPGQASEIKNLMEEIKKWKEGSIFDKSPIRTKTIKPQQMIPKAHSTQTSPRSSPPPGSPGPKRSSSLNRNRSKSLKLLTDKLKSPKGGSKDGPASPSVSMSKSTPAEGFFSRSANNTKDEAVFLDNNTECEGSEQINQPNSMQDVNRNNKEQAIIVEPIPEFDEKLEDEHNDQESSTPEYQNQTHDQNKTGSRSDLSVKPKLLKESSQNIEDEAAVMSDGDTPATHVSSFTLHPIDRNSQFLRLRQTAPPKRRPGYAGLTLPRPNISLFKKQPSDDPREKKCSQDDSVIKKPSKLELPGLGVRKLSAPRFLGINRSKDEPGALDISGENLFRTPISETPPSVFGEETVDYSPSESRSVEDEPEIVLGATGGTPVDETESEKVIDSPDKLERRNNKSPKQKSKSDPSGNNTFDFETSRVINSNQSHSFPLLGKDGSVMSIQEISETEAVNTENTDTGTNSNKVSEDNNEFVSVPSDLDILNNNENASQEQFRTPSGSFSEPEGPSSLSFSEGNLYNPQCDSGSAENLSPRPPGFESLTRSGLEGMSPLHEDEEALSLTNSVQSAGSESSTSTPISYSPTGTLEYQHNLLSVPSPKRPILRSVSSASVLQRERKFSGGNKEKENHRKHSLTTGEDGVPAESHSGDFLHIGEGNVLASSMPLVWGAERAVSMSPERDSQYMKVITASVFFFICSSLNSIFNFIYLVAFYWIEMDTHITQCHVNILHV